ncbi:MAG: exosortase U [Planctomyces sp.]|nr:exosortase U [Planctomyces sp.]
MEISDRGVLSESRHRWLALCLCVAGVMPIVYWHLGHLLKREHYQFLILLPVACWMLLKSRDDTGSAASSGRSSFLTAFMALVCSLTVLAAATWVWSPWLGAVGALFGILSVILASGREVTARWAAVWVLMWLTVPLPFGLDEELIVRLRDVTTRMSSAVLDQIGVLHLTYANVIEVPSKPLFIADACSGVHSLYVLLSVALLAGLFLKRGVLHIILLVASTLGLVLVENVLRIVVVALGLEYSIDLSEGWQHTVLGAVLFSVSVGLILSVDQFLNFILAELPFSFSLRWLVRGNRRKQAANKSKSDIGETAGRPDSDGGRRKALPLFVAASLLYPAIGIAQVLLMPDDAPTLGAIFPDELVVRVLGADALPKEIEGLEQRKFQTVGRVEGDPFGKTSQQWEYGNTVVDAVYSVDYPYPGAHDLCLCYELIGWKVIDQQLLSADDLSARLGVPVTDGSVVMARLRRELYGEALVFFSVSDSTGQYTAQSRKADKPRGNLVDERFAKQRGAGAETKPRFVPPFIQYQCFAKSFLPFSDEQVNGLLKSYMQVRGELKRQIYSK